MVSADELEQLLAACVDIPVLTKSYHQDDYVTNVLLTVLDLQMHNVAVERAIRHYRDTSGTKSGRSTTWKTFVPVHLNLAPSLAREHRVQLWAEAVLRGIADGDARARSSGR